MSERDVKQPFDIDVALERIAEAVRPYPKAAMFELAERGFQYFITNPLGGDEETVELLGTEVMPAFV